MERNDRTLFSFIRVNVIYFNNYMYEKIISFMAIKFDSIFHHFIHSRTTNLSNPYA